MWKFSIHFFVHVHVFWKFSYHELAIEMLQYLQCSIIIICGLWFVQTKVLGFMGIPRSGVQSLKCEITENNKKYLLRTSYGNKICMYVFYKWFL